MLKYIALFETDEYADGVGVVFPDFPGCVSAGKNYYDALKNAHEILADIIEEKKANGEDVPQPRTLEQIKKEWEDWQEWQDNYTFTVGYVYYIPEAKPKKYTIMLNSGLIARIDAVCRNRSAFIAKAIEQALSPAE